MALLRALAAGAPDFALHEIESRDWSSATFVGERHRMVIELADDDAASAWLAALPDAELHVAGRLVADVAVASACRANGQLHVTIEALTLLNA